MPPLSKADREAMRMAEVEMRIRPSLKAREAAIIAAFHEAREEDNGNSGNNGKDRVQS